MPRTHCKCGKRLIRKQGRGRPPVSCKTCSRQRLRAQKRAWWSDNRAQPKVKIRYPRH